MTIIDVLYFGLFILAGGALPLLLMETVPKGHLHIQRVGANKAKAFMGGERHRRWPTRNVLRLPGVSFGIHTCVELPTDGEDYIVVGMKVWIRVTDLHQISQFTDCWSVTMIAASAVTMAAVECVGSNISEESSDQAASIICEAANSRLLDTGFMIASIDITEIRS